MKQEDILILGGIAVIIYLLYNNQGGQAATSAVSTSQGLPSCDSCGSSKAAPVTTPSAQTCPSGTIFRNGICDNPALGSVVNDLTLQKLNDLINQSNAVGNWALSWQYAAQRDAWVKQQGY